MCRAGQTQEAHQPWCHSERVGFGYPNTTATLKQQTGLIPSLSPCLLTFVCLSWRFRGTQPLPGTAAHSLRPGKPRLHHQHHKDSMDSSLQSTSGEKICHFEEASSPISHASATNEEMEMGNDLEISVH